MKSPPPVWVASAVIGRVASRLSQIQVHEGLLEVKERQVLVITRLGCFDHEWLRSTKDIVKVRVKGVRNEVVG